MRLESDLGITDDDGWELFEEIERQFAVALFCSEYSLRAHFQLTPNQTFFHSEGFAPWLSLLLRMFGRPKEEVRDIAIEELYSALVELKRVQSHGAGG